MKSEWGHWHCAEKTRHADEIADPFSPQWGHDFCTSGLFLSVSCSLPLSNGIIVTSAKIQTTFIRLSRCAFDSIDFFPWCFILPLKSVFDQFPFFFRNLNTLSCQLFAGIWVEATLNIAHKSRNNHQSHTEAQKYCIRIKVFLRWTSEWWACAKDEGSGSGCANRFNKVFQW